MRVLRPIVQPLVLAVLGAGQHRLEGWSVAGELVGHRNTGLVRVRFHDPLQERLGAGETPSPTIWGHLASSRSSLAPPWLSGRTRGRARVNGASGCVPAGLLAHRRARIIG